MTICLTGLSGGVAMAVIMSLYFMLFAPPVAFITFAGIATGLVVLEWLRRRSTAVTREVTAAQEAMTDKVIEYARGMAVLRTFATPDEALAEAKASFEQKRLADYRQEQAAQGILKLYALVFNLASCAVLFAACALYLTGGLPLSWALTLLVAAFMIYGELISANNGAFLTKKIEGELDRVDEVCAVPRQDTTDEPLAPRGFDLAMDGVSFGYDDRRVIDHVTLRIPEGTSCAIVGPSGSGKTTLVNLLARFWDVDEGFVSVGGADVRDGTAESLLSHISLVFQNVYLFNDTVENNIRFGRPDASRDEVVAAARRARCHDFIERLPQGYDTVLEEGGADLSGGERQRISIARAIMKDAPIVILDEATSSVDPENEHLLMEAIGELTRGKTLVTIAHRLNTVRNAGQILVVDAGRVVQRGTHDELMREDGIYRRFIRMREEAADWRLGASTDEQTALHGIIGGLPGGDPTHPLRARLLPQRGHSVPAGLLQGERHQGAGGPVRRRARRGGCPGRAPDPRGGADRPPDAGAPPLLRGAPARGGRGREDRLAGGLPHGALPVGGLLREARRPAGRERHLTGPRSYQTKAEHANKAVSLLLP